MDNQHLAGLTTREAAARRERGLGNNIKLQTSRSYAEILRENVFTFINNVLFALGLALILLGRASDAFVSVGIILINVLVSVVQEIRAKRTLDRIALMTRPTAVVLRDGREQTLDPADVVQGDVLAARPGDQIVVDGKLLEGRLNADESLLTGESDLVKKSPGDILLSGSFCVSGSGFYLAEKVGQESFANQVTKGARAFRRVVTPIQQETNLVIRILLMIAVYFEFILLVDALLNRIPFVESVKMSVVIAGLVPNGLFVAIALSYALGAVRIAGKGALVQQSNAIESLSNVDVLCLDKTGTLTANQIVFHDLCAFELDEERLRQLLGDFAASTLTPNKTIEAIASALPGQKRPLAAEVPFSSERKWSALAVDDAEMHGTYFLGALEMLEPALVPGENIAVQAANRSDQGLRVLLFAFSSEVTDPNDADGNPSLPDELVPLGLVSFSDVLRPEARETLMRFKQAGVNLKIISGDNPLTVVALARQAGLGEDLISISGLDLEEMSPEEFAEAAETCTVFGRITPQQKEKLVAALRARGHYVAMIGDGVNDVLSLKQSNLGIAMQSGSQATRAVADIILLKDTFASLPFAVREGQRIINGMHSILRLFLSRTFFVALAILSTSILGGFPFSPKQSSVLALMAVGLPTMALAAWSHPGPTIQGSLIRRMLRFVLPAALTMAVFGLLLYAGFLLLAFQGISQFNPEGQDFKVMAVVSSGAQTALTCFSILCGLALILFVQPPTKFWAVDGEVTSDRRPAWLAAGLFAAYVLFLVVQPFSAGFDFVPLNIFEHLVILLSAGLWVFAVRWTWRSRLVERFFSADLRI